MNRSIRNVAVATFVLFTLLVGSLSFRQFFDAPKLNADKRNTRETIKQFSENRGAILVDGKPIAQSTPSKDQYNYQRQYTQGPLYAPLTGFFSLIYGTSGLESELDSDLLPQSNSIFNSQLLQKTAGTNRTSAVELTIDPDLQLAAYNALGDYKGAAVAMDPKTGNILAMVSKPSYDPNSLASHDGATVNNSYKKLVADPQQPLINRAIAGNLYAPGSTFKLVVAAAALESGKYKEGTMVEGRSPITLPGTHTSLPNDGDVNCGNQEKVPLKIALAYSCNTAFATVGIALGNPALTEMTNKFGFGKELDIPLSVTPSSFPTKMNNSQLGTSAIGQWNVKETPLQVTMNTAAIANKGVMMKPNLVKDVRGPDMNVTKQTKPEKYLQPISANTASKITDMMKYSVSNGVAWQANIPGADVAGKTGTAETTANGKYNLSFTGFAPASDPKIAVTVVVEQGGDATTEASGSSVAIPVANEIMKEALNK
ncbi:MAG: penicillin-binding protein 2 [Micrococcaceae bacterium]